MIFTRTMLLVGLLVLSAMSGCGGKPMVEKEKPKVSVDVKDGVDVKVGDDVKVDVDKNGVDVDVDPK